MSEDLEETFHAAADHLGQLVSANPTSVHDAVKLQLYGLYKQAVSGSCTAPKPPFWQRAARLKWNHWNKLGALPAQDAMQQYIETLQNVDPDWQAAAAASSRGPKQKQGGAGGPVFSTLRDPEAEHDQQQGDSSLQEAAGQGDVATLKTLLSSGACVDARDESGCTALHFAADRGQLEAAELLLDAGAAVNATDADGATPLHNAAMCGHEGVCRLLLQRGADASKQDSDGQTARQLAPADWTCWGQQ